MLRNEWIKSWNWKKILGIVIFIFITNVVLELSSENISLDTWVDYANQTLNDYKNTVIEFEQQGMGKEYTASLYKKIAEIEYSIDNNIPFGVRSVFNHIILISNIFPVYMIVITVLLSNILMCEYNSNMWKNLLCTGTSKSKLLSYKIAYAVIEILCYFILLFGITSLFGLVSYGIPYGHIGRCWGQKPLYSTTKSSYILQLIPICNTTCSII